MMKHRKKEQSLTLACSACQSRNYSTSISQTYQVERFERRKYCPHCTAHTLHRETR